MPRVDGGCTPENPLSDRMQDQMASLAPPELHGAAAGRLLGLPGSCRTFLDPGLGLRWLVDWQLLPGTVILFFSFYPTHSTGAQPAS